MLSRFVNWLKLTEIEKQEIDQDRQQNKNTGGLSRFLN